MGRLAGAFPAAVLHASAADVTDAEAVVAEISAIVPDACVHLAAVSAVPETTRAPDRAWQVNLHGTLNLARAILAHAPACLLLFVSSGDAYGDAFRAGVPVDERMALAPLNTYGATKAAADLALGAMVGEGLRCLRMRPFNHTGPGQSDAFVVASFARQVALIAAGRQPPVVRVGALDGQRDFLDVRDVCAAYAAGLRLGATLASGTIFNIASGTPRRIGDVLQALFDVAGITAEIHTERGRLRPTDIPVASGDASRARALLGWQPIIAWEQTISDVLRDWSARIAAS